MSGRPAVLSIHSVDTLGEEGVLVDAAVYTEMECRPVSVVTSILATGQKGIEVLEGLSLALVAQQFESLIGVCRPLVARTGILKDARQVELVAGLLDHFGIHDLVVAPIDRVGGARVLDKAGAEATRQFLFPLARVVVLRAVDAPTFVGESVEDIDGMKRAASTIRAQGAKAALVAGASWRGRVVDVLDENGHVSVFDSQRVIAPRAERLSGAHAAALAAHLARGAPLARAVDAAQRYVALRLQRFR